MTTAPSFILRPSAVMTSSGEFNTRPLSVGGVRAVNVEVQVAHISGASATLTVAVQTSVDGKNWTDLEGEVSSTTAGLLKFFRLGLGRWIRLRGSLSGTSPAATFSVIGDWLGRQPYPAITASIDNAPLTQGGTANLSGETGVAGALVHYELTFDVGDPVSGDLTADKSGSWSSAAAVSTDATLATLDVFALAQTAQDSTEVNPDIGP